jgi:hypothetical protein
MHHESCVVGEAPAKPQGLVEKGGIDLSTLPTRDGTTYDHGRDGQRLANQHARIFELMKDGQWRTLGLIAAMTRDPESSVSARLRDFRKPKFGGHGVERRHLGQGLFEYRLVIRPELVLT